jgi:hypothetical protein
MNRKWLKRIGVGLVLLVLLAAVGVYSTWSVIRSRGKEARDAAIAKLDAEDPNWRAADLCAVRNKTIPAADENSAERALQAVKLIPKSFDEWTKQEKWRGELKPGVLPHDEDVCELAAVHMECGEALVVARSIRHLPRGGFKLEFDQSNPLNTSIENTQMMREAASLLDVDVIMLCYTGRADEAVESCHALLNTARSIGDEPTLISQLVRMALLAITRSAVERALGWGEPTAGLAELKAALAAELSEKRLTYGLRGERAMMFLLTEGIETGQVDLGGVAGSGPTGGLKGRAETTALRLHLPQQQATMLRLYSEMIAASELNGPERKAAFDAIQLPQGRRFADILINLLLPAIEKVAQAETRTQAQLGCAIAAIACERYRQRFGKWPESLATIPKDVLPKLPTDPYTGKRLLYKITADGPVVYTTGPDETDDGAEVIDPKGDKGMDVGFRLFHPDRRRQVPPPKPTVEPWEEVPGGPDQP